MRKVQELNYKFTKWIFSHVLDNTILTVIITAFTAALVALLLNNIISLLTEWPDIVWGVIVSLLIIIMLYYFFAHEKTLIKAKITTKNLKDEWQNNEIRIHIPSIATVDEDESALYLQFMDVPFLLNKRLPPNYAFEFKAKILNQVFSWCSNAKIDNGSMRAYMFQYNPIEKRLRPHFLSGYDKNKALTLWVLPDIKNSPLLSVDNLELQERNGWYYIRTEVRESEKTVKLPDLDQEIIQSSIPTYRNSEGDEIKFSRDNINKVVEIKIYDMYKLGKVIYHNYFHEPPFQCFLGGNVGFRNYQFESALYKDVIIKEL